MTVETIQDPLAEIQIITGDDWAPWFTRAASEAQESLHLTYYMISPYWRGPNATAFNLIKVLAAAAQRGLTCRLIIDQPNVAFTTRPFNARAGEALVRAGWKVRVMPDARTLHEKIMIVDKSLSLVGSHNISKASATSNYDTSLAIRSIPLAERLHRQFWERWRLAKTLTVTP